MYMSRFLLGALLLHGAAAHTNMVGILSAVDTLNFPSYPQCAMVLYSCPSTSAAASSCDTLTYGRDGTDGDSTNVFRAEANVESIVWPEDVGNSEVATGSRTAADVDGVANPDSLVSDSGGISDEADTDTHTDNPLKAVVGTDGDDIPDSFDSDLDGDGIPDALAGTVSVGIPDPLCDSAGDGSPDEESFSHQRAPEPQPWAGISTFGFWCCLIALVAVVGFALRCDTRGARGGRGFHHPPRCSFALSSVIALCSTRGMRAFIVIRLVGVALAQVALGSS